MLNLATRSHMESTPPGREIAAVPCVSVVMTTYNGAQFLVEQIDSILRQSVADFELIIADDCSSDATPALLRAYAERDTRVRLLLNERNLGLHDNLERALRTARGRFIAISDQDDVWSPQKLECLLQHIGERSAVYSDSLLVNAAGHSLGMTLLQRLKLKQPATDDRAVALMRKNCVSGHALLFRRELLELALPFDARLMFDQQLGFFAALAHGLSYVDEPLVQHRIHDRNHTNGALAIPTAPATSLRRQPRLQRYRRRRAELVDKLECCITLMGNFRSADISKRVNGTAELLAKVAARLRRFDQTLFDLQLFFLLWRIRRQLFYRGEDKGLHLCLKYAKGARYYALTAQLWDRQ
jgi:glycosyltransferase involved in cell wall biosynthesis